MSNQDKSDYLAGWKNGVAFVERYRAYPKLVLQYAKWHVGRYRQRPSDDGFVDACNAAFGA
jgi:hypothetical protein